VASLKLAASRTGPWLPAARVIPLYTAFERVANVSAAVPSAGRHPEMVPSSLAKDKQVPVKSGRVVEQLAVGLPAPGIVTTSGTLLTVGDRLDHWSQNTMLICLFHCH